MSKYCNTCGAELQDEQTSCTNCGTAQIEQDISNSQDNITMKWFKFIIYFQLIASAVLNVINGISYLTGSIYSGNDFVYIVFPSLMYLDKIYGVCTIVMAIFAIFVRTKLAKFRKGAIKLYYAFLIAATIVNSIYLIVLKSIVPSVGIASNIGSIIGFVILLVINNIYFKKREHLFVN